MSVTELQKNVIQKVLKTSDIQLLKYLNSLLTENDSSSLYTLYDVEMENIEDGISKNNWAETIDNDEFIYENEKISNKYQD